MCRIALALSVMLVANRMAKADLIPPGSKGIRHKLVFIETEALTNNRVVAAPVRGFGESTEIRAGQRFSFSSKYGTRLYIVPDELSKLPEFEFDSYEIWPSLEIPVSEIRSVPWISPIASAITTLRLADTAEGLTVEVVSHEEFDASNQPVSFLRSYLPLAIPLLVGIAACFYIARRARGRRSRESTEELSQSE